MHPRTIEEEPIESERLNLVKLIRKWGDVNTDGLLEENCLKFSTPDIEGFVGYKIEAMNAVVLGDPVCSPEDRPFLAKAFADYCQSQKLGAVYTMASQDFVEWASKELSAIAIEFGTKFILDPLHLPTQNKGSKAVLVRKKVKQALKEGVEVKEYFGNDLAIEREIENLTKTWVENRKGFQIYLCPVNLFDDRYGKRWFYAIHHNRIVGVLVLNRLQAQDGWLLNNIMMTFDAPKGLSELLIISALEALNMEGCRFVLIGPIPSSELKKITGVGQFKAAIMHFVYKLAVSLFKLDGHATFWDKFQPQHESSYIVFPKRNLGFSSIRAIFKAFNASKG